MLLDLFLSSDRIIDILNPDRYKEPEKDHFELLAKPRGESSKEMRFLYIIIILTVALPAAAQPSIDGTIVAAIVGQPLTIAGSGFGERDSRSSLALIQGSEMRQIPAISDEIVNWTDRKIVLRLPQGARSGRVRIKTAAGESRDTRLEIYRYEWFNIPPTPDTNAMPLAIARATNGTLWINQEFHLDLQRFDPATGRVTGIPIPRPPMPGPFGMELLGNDIQTQISMAGEDIIVDPGGRVWFTQGGGYLYKGVPRITAV